MATLKVTKREGTGKYVAFNMRKEGFIPGVIYGRSLDENINLKVPLKEFMHMVHHGERLLDLDVEGETYSVIVKEVQHGTFDHEIMHADFRQISDTDTLHVEIEVVLKGESKGEAAGGVIEQGIHRIEIECNPKNLPENVMLDITALEVGSVLYVSDLPAIEGVKYASSPDIAVVSCHMPAGEEESEDEDEEAAEPEVIGAKKDEE